MVLGIGCDIVEVHRFEKWLDNIMLQKKYFTNIELDVIKNKTRELAMQQLAGMFAAKESFIKAVTKKVVLTDLVIERDSMGAPRLRLERSALKASKQLGATYTKVSISHEKKYAVAMVVIGC